MTNSSKSELWLFKYLPLPFAQLLTNRGQSRIVAENAAWLISERFIRLVLGVFVGAWVARYLGPSQFGQLSYVFAFLAFFQAVAGLGLDSIIVRDLSRNPEMAGEILGSTIVMRTVVGLIGWFAATVSMAFLEKSEPNLILITAIIGSCLIFQVADVFDIWFQSQSLNRRTVIVKMAAAVVAAALKVACIVAGAKLMVFALITALEFAAIATGLTISYFRRPATSQLRCSLRITRDLLKESAPLVLAGLSIIIYMRIDMILIRYLLGEASVGNYAAAMPLSTLWHVIPVSLCMSAAPLIARKKLEGDDQYYEALQKIFRLCLISSVVVCVTVFFMAESLSLLLYGESYLETGSILKIHIFSNIPIFMGVARGLWTTNEGRQAFAAWCTVAGALIAIIANLLFIPHFGVLGAAATALVAQFVSAVFSSILVSKRVFLMQIGFRPQ